MTFEEILENEGLADWKVKMNTGSGLCVPSRKEIWMGNDPEDLALFLHEVAHAQCPKDEFASWYKDDPTGHFSIWGDRFTRLVGKYMEAKP